MTADGKMAFTRGNVLRVAAEAADASDAAEAAFRTHQGRRDFGLAKMVDVLADATLTAEAVLAAWLNVAESFSDDTVGPAPKVVVVRSLEQRADTFAGPDPEEFDNRTAAALLLVAAALRTRFA